MHRLDFSDTGNRNLGRILQLHAEQSGDLIFLMEQDRRVSFGEANAEVNRMARGLADMGVDRGDRVAFYMHSAIEVVFFALAANKLGAIWIPINTDYKGEWLRDSLRSSRVNAIAVDGALLPRLAEVIDQVPDCHVLLHRSEGEEPGWTRPLASLSAYSDAEHDLSAIDYGDVSSILWTSGTTGKSKGVMQSHNVWVRCALSGSAIYETNAGDSVYNIMPLYNSAAWSTNILRALVEGIPCALDPGFSVKTFWDRIRYYNATQTFTLGAMHIFLWQAPERPDDRDNPLRTAGMTPMPDDLLEPFCERFGIKAINQGFGQSEVLGLISRPSRPGAKWKKRSLGVLLDDMELRLIDDDGKDVPTGEVGEFAVKAKYPHTIFEGYFDTPDANAKAFTTDGWYRMGDLGRRDADGDWFFVDRKKDAVRYKGRNISTMEVESVVHGYPGIAEVAAFGVPSAELDSEDELALAIVPKPGAVLEAEALARHINDNAPYYFVPRYIEFVDSLPYTPTNKVQKFELRKRGMSENAWNRDKAGFVLER